MPVFSVVKLFAISLILAALVIEDIKGKFLGFFCTVVLIVMATRLKKFAIDFYIC